MESVLFDRYPVLEDDMVTLRKMTMDDAEALAEMCGQEEVYRYVPTFLYEQKYEDKKTVLARMDEEMFAARESLFLGIYLKESGRFAGIAEFYAYEPDRRKCSIGIRLRKEYWGMGIATRCEKLMVEYLLQEAHMRIITAHVMQENKASGAALEKNGFVKKYCGIREDWGFAEPVIIDKYIIKIRD